jgi:hypothetical protein
MIYEMSGSIYVDVFVDVYADVFVDVYADVYVDVLSLLVRLDGNQFCGGL